MDYKLVDDAIAFVRTLAAKNNDDVPSWGKYEEVVRERLKEPFNPKPKMPKEYYYAYLRVKGMSDSEARDRMGLTPESNSNADKKKSFWKLW